MLPQPGFMQPDRVPPTVAITSPAAGNVTGTITVAAAVSDNDQVKSVQFYLDGVALGALVTAAPWQISWNTATATTGAHTLTAVATDRNNNTKTSSPVSVTVADQHAPSVSITSPGNGGSGSQTITLTASASDDVGVSHVDYYLDGSYIGSGSGGSWSLNYDTRSVADGWHTFNAYAYDAAGNQSPVSSISFYTSNNIAYVAGGANTGGSVTFGAVPANSVIVVGVFVPGAGLNSLWDNGGNGYTYLGSVSCSAPGGGGALYMYAALTPAVGTSQVLANSTGGIPPDLVVGVYQHAQGGLQFGGGAGNWGRWGGPSSSMATSRALQAAVTWAGYDNGANNPAVSVNSPFVKRQAITDYSNTWGELALLDWTTTSGGTSGPSGGTNNNADVYGIVGGFENS